MKNSETLLLHPSEDLSLVYRHLPGARSAIFGVAVRAGSADDGTGFEGLAHFVEHTIFKGTAKRSSWHIINRMETVGGELNAYTTKEETVVYTTFPAGNEARAAELVADLIVNSRFPEREILREKDVVADEIDSYLDSPSEAVFDDFEDILFAGTPVGHNILGSRETLEKITPQLCRDYLERNYTADNLVIFYSGPRPAAQIQALVTREFNALPKTAYRTRQNNNFPTAAPFRETRNTDTHQAHTIVGAPVGSLYSDDRFALALFCNIIGGPGMNSLLNVELRERRGLVYSVEASTALFTGAGVLTVYFGCDPADRNRCHQLVISTLEKLADGAGFNERRLAHARKQYLGQCLIASENRENSILAAARSALFHGHITAPSQIEEAINAVSLSDIRSQTTHFLSQASSLTLM